MPDSKPSELERQLGLSIRYLAEGIPALPMAIGDAMNSATNLGIGGLNKMADTHVPFLQLPSSILSQGLTNAGVPQPRTNLENIIGQLSQSIAATPFIGAVSGATNAMKLSPWFEHYWQEARLASKVNGPAWAQIPAGILGGGLFGDSPQSSDQRDLQ